MPGWSMEPIPVRTDVDFARLFADERASLLTLVGELSADDWTRSTPCPGWSVLDLVLHLAGNDLGLLARQRDDHFGTRPPATLQGDLQFAAWLDGLQNDWVRAARRLSPRLARDLLSWTGHQVAAMFEQQDPTAIESTVSWASDGPVPRWLDQARELSECWIHRQQLLESVGRPPDHGIPAAAAVIDTLRWAYPYRLAGLPRPDGETVDIEITGPLSRRWYLQCANGSWRFQPTPGPVVVARLTVTIEQAWRLLSNNLAPKDQLDLDAKGDAGLVDALRRTRAIIGIPNSP